MNGQMTVIVPDGSIRKAMLTQPPELAELQSLVGGYIEQVPLFDYFMNRPCVAYCNEEGKLQNLPYNDAATTAWHALGWAGMTDVLVGNVVILSGDDEFMEAL